jgi:drug/metabolite transporter (DMT)-like permease
VASITEGRDDLRRGALLMLASAVLFAGMSVAVKLASRVLPGAMVVFARNVLGLAVLLPWIARAGGGLATDHLREHLVRSLAGLAAMYCFFYAIGHMRLADAVLLNYSLPLVMPLVAKLWLAEPIPRRLWRTLGVGFAGLVLILKPSAGLFDPVALVGLAAAIFASVAQVGIRSLTRTEPAARIVFYFGAVSTLVSAVPLAWSGWRTPEAGTWGILVAMGVLATAAQLLLTQAYAHAPAAQVGPFIYSAVVFAALFDWLLWKELPDALTAAGALLVCASGILALRQTGRPAVS